MNLHVTLRLAATLIFLVAAPCWSAIVITDPGQGRVSIAGAGASELSGLAHVVGDQFYAVSDDSGSLYDLTIAINSTTGFISSASINSAQSLAGSSDQEGVAYNAANGRVLVSDEGNINNSIATSIREHRIDNGVVTNTVAVPAVYGDSRHNLGLESLSLSPGSAALWTANEEALYGDGPVSSPSVGTVVRLQKFDATYSPVGQWAYQVDPHQGNSPYTTGERSGVADLVALPGGSLLVLERAFGGTGGFGGTPQFRSRIYVVDFTGATDVSSLANLDSNGNNDLGDETWVGGGKGSPLWEITFDALTGLTNFEGMAYVPDTSGTDHSLLLISDDGGGARQDLYALRVSGVPEPSTAIMLVWAIGLLSLAPGSRRHGIDRIGNQAGGMTRAGESVQTLLGQVARSERFE